MAGSYKSVILKMTRAREHFDSLGPEIDAVNDLLRQGHKNVQVPHCVGLVCGDCLQNMRSALDYLIYELVLANGGKPNRKHMFPIAMSEDQYERDGIHKIKGIHPRAAAFIDALQPYLLEHPSESPLYVLDELTNLNKHRRPIITTMQATTVQPPFLFPHVQGTIKRLDPRTQLFEESPFFAWVGFDELPVKGAEVTHTLNLLAFTLSEQIFPLFKDFLDAF
jgi:hypothetical protein